ncbi:MAG: hypothetical protein GY701_28700 [Sulfitobacter sp.]|nr:hypothetical protein [Sulfitobacter sp.]
MTSILVDPVPTEPIFTLHSAVWTGWPDYLERTTLFGTKIFKGLEITSESPTKVTAHAHHQIGDRMVTAIARAYTDTPWVDCWVMVVYGHTATSQVTWPRETVEVHLPNGKVVLDEETEGHVGHGQALIQRWRWNFLEDKPGPVFLKNRRAKGDQPPPYFSVPNNPPWIQTQTEKLLAFQAIIANEARQAKPWDRTQYISVFPGKTGDQEAFGHSHIHADLSIDNNSREPIWFELLRNEACRPGKFLNPDFSFATEELYPDIVLDSGGWFHPNSTGRPWFKPDGYDMMARAPDGTKWRFFDDQHWGIGVIAQVYWLYDDPGLGLLLRHLTEAFLFTTPVVPKGTTHHKAGAARAQGRELQAAAALYWAFKDPRLVDRIDKLVRIQWDSYQENGIPTNWDPATNQPTFFPHEIGEWVAGLYAAVKALESTDTEGVAIDYAQRMGMDLALFLLDNCWVDWGDGVYATPYRVWQDLTGHSPDPSWGLSQWSLAALQLLKEHGGGALDEVQTNKLDAILKQWVDEMKPQRHGGGWPERIEWLVM